MTLGERIKKTRNEKGRSLRDLAAELDLSASFLSQIEQGKASPSIENLKKIANSLDVKVSYLIEDEEVKKELVIQKDGKECTYNLPKGIYTYEVLLSSKDTYQKGEYKVTEETLMTVNRN